MEKTSDALVISRALVRAKSKIWEYAEVILWAVVLALIIRTCVVEPFKIPTRSMEDTLLTGDYLLVNKFIYGIKIPFTNLRSPAFRAPEQGDVIVFKYPEDRSKNYIKRVIGVPGDEIQIRDKQVYVNGKVYKNVHEVYKDPEILPSTSEKRDNFGPILVAENSYFVMGDNRDYSYDSRFWGFVKKSDLVGLAIIKWWSLDHDNRQVRWQRIGRLID